MEAKERAVIIEQGFRMYGSFYPASDKAQTVPARVAEAAVATGLAADPEAKAKQPAPENKAKAGAPENK